MTEEATKDFFISYNKADRGWAEWIAWQLEAEGYSTIIQAWDFRPGGNFILEMDHATTVAKRTIAVLSPDYLDALFTKPEWAEAFRQDPTGKEGKLLPVRVRTCTLIPTCGLW
jgi:TIR domain